MEFWYFANWCNNSQFETPNLNISSTLIPSNVDKLSCQIQFSPSHVYKDEQREIYCVNMKTNTCFKFMLKNINNQNTINK